MELSEEQTEKAGFKCNTGAHNDIGHPVTDSQTDHKNLMGRISELKSTWLSVCAQCSVIPHSCNHRMSELEKNLVFFYPNNFILQWHGEIKWHLKGH